MKNCILIFSFFCLYTGSLWSGIQSKCDGEVFDGTIREEAKTSIGSGSIETMSASEFLNTFKGHPELNDNSPRSEIEQRNVTITAWLYTYAREDDEDFHLILGLTSKSTNKKFISAEISGLPKNPNSKFYDRLKKARNQFKEVILKGNDYCSGFTEKLFKKPIKVTVTGSVFYDSHHGSGGSGTGKYKAKSPWEIHPITSIVIAE